MDRAGRVEGQARSLMVAAAPAVSPELAEIARKLAALPPAALSALQALLGLNGDEPPRSAEDAGAPHGASPATGDPHSPA
jgi:hypothetical protein